MDATEACSLGEWIKVCPELTGDLQGNIRVTEALLSRFLYGETTDL
jgi:hypothetical protein